ncbi:hypothetical protein YC2023_045663 [Brassica napus]|nr:unnamed protein product [Brassica napus]
MTWSIPPSLRSWLCSRLDLKFTDRFKFYKVDIDEEEAISARYHIHTIPTNIVFKGGDEVARVTGYYPGKVRELMDQYV